MFIGQTAGGRLYAFADCVSPRHSGSRLVQLMNFLAGAASPVAKYTPKDWNVDGVFDIRAIIQQSHLDAGWEDMHDFLKPTVAPHGLTDYEKAFSPVDDVDQDIFDLRGIDRGADALVVVRPDQYVAHVLPLDGYDELTRFFDGFMTPQ